jgi:transposase
MRRAELDPPDVLKKHRAFKRWRRGVDLKKLVFTDEASPNRSMGRSHAWIPRVPIRSEPGPQNWGKNMTMIGAMHLSGGVTMGAMYKSATRERFVSSLRPYLAPKPCRGDIVVVDNARAHHDPEVAPVLAAVVSSVEYLPPYGYDLSPTKPGWALVKKHIRANSPGSPFALRRVGHRVRRRITPAHCDTGSATENSSFGPSDPGESGWFDWKALLKNGVSPIVMGFFPPRSMRTFWGC